jgi:hypothetical protein
MPKRFSDDIDLVPHSPAKKPALGPPPSPWPLPKFEPFTISKEGTRYGIPNLPDGVNADSTIGIFKLFFTSKVVDKLVEHTNLNAELNPRTNRPFKPCGKDEMYTYIGITLVMGIHPEPQARQYWNTKHQRFSIYPSIRRAMPRDRWLDIDHFFYIETPCTRPLYPPPRTDCPPSSSLPPKRRTKPAKDPEKRTPFDKVEWLTDHLRAKFKEYWEEGTHLAVDECMVRFVGRAYETVTIPNKPTPEGFKIWVLANMGYVLDFMYHAKGPDGGPVDLDDYFTKELYFSKTHAVVLDLLASLPENGKDHIVWLDNLFTTSRLLSHLRDQGIGAAGTVRTANTRREMMEAGMSEAQAEKQFESADPVVAGGGSKAGGKLGGKSRGLKVRNL